MTKKELKKYQSVDMKWFLQTYYGIDKIFISSLSNASHKEIKIIAEIYGLDLPKISFDDLTKEMLLRGEVILVRDKKGNVAPYIAPSLGEKEDILNTPQEYIYGCEKEDKDDKHKRR